MKRFIDTEIWHKPWFRKLPPAEKLAWFWMTLQCDNVGVIAPDFELAEFMIGDSVDWEHLSANCNENIEVLPNGKWWFVDYVRIQHADLFADYAESGKKPSTPCRSYVALLQQHGLYDRFPSLYKAFGKPLPGLDKAYKEKDKDKDKERVKVRDKEEESGEKKELATKIRDMFFDLQEDKTVFDFKREVPHCKSLAEKALKHPDPEAFLKQLFGAYVEKKRKDKFYKTQPMLPSIINSSGVYAQLVEVIAENGRHELSDDEKAFISNLFQEVNQ